MSSRMQLVGASVILLFGVAAPAAEPLPGAGDNARQFAIECRVVDATGRREQVQVCPKITVFEHEPATISNLTRRPFVVAVKPAENNAVEPIVEVLDEGWTIDLCCHANNDGKLTLDATIAESRIATVDVVAINEHTNVQQPRLEVAKRRQFVAAKEGERFTMPLDDQPAGKSRRWAELMVREQRTDTK